MSPPDPSAPDTRRPVRWGEQRQALAARPVLLAMLLPIWLAMGCTTVHPPAGVGQSSSLPVLSGWFDGEEVFYITTDVSRADVAAAKGANFAPRLALALPEGPAVPGRSSVDKVYAVTNFKQASVFASAPFPMGSTSRDTAYSPLWQMVKVTWAAGATPRVLKSEEDVLAAAERGAVVLEATRVVLNCPIVHRGTKGALPGVSITHPPR